MKRFNKIVVLCILLMTSQLFAQEKMDKLILAGPKAPVTPPLAYIVEAGLLDDVAKKVELRVWKNPNQLRSLIVTNKVHFTASATQIAAKLYNKGIPLKLMNISVWGDYTIVSNDKNLNSLEGLRGKEVAVPFRNGTPSTIFKLLATKSGIDTSKDLKIKYLPNFAAAMQEVASGRVDYAFLSEPHASMAVIKTKGKKNQLYKSIDLAKQWGELYNTEPKISRAGMVALPSILNRPDIVQAFQKAYEKAVDWCNANPKKAGILAQKYIKGFKAKAVTMSLRTGTVEFKSALDARKQIEMFYSVLLKANPKKIGGKLPDDGFYCKVTNTKKRIYNKESK